MIKGVRWAVAPDRPSIRFGFRDTIIVLALAVASVVWLPGCASSRYAKRAEAVKISWAEIPGGAFVMGDTFEETNLDALPLHRVSLEPFALTRHEITFAQFDAFALDTGSRLPEDPDGVRGDRAVADVDWDEASAFCKWIGGRLPSEQEWEFAAAGGPDKQRYAGTDDEADLGEYARIRINSTAAPGIVGRKLPNRFGLFDLSGNVAEWIGRFYQFYPETGTAPVFDDPDITGIRILRGGSYSMEAEVTRTYWRAGTLREVRSPAIGFRCAQDR